MGSIREFEASKYSIVSKQDKCGTILNIKVMSNRSIVLESIDEPCKNLLREVEQKIMIDFELHDCKQYDFQVIERDRNRIPTKGRVRYYEPIDSCKITHELLHAKCSYVLGYDKVIYQIVENLTSNTAKIVLNSMCASILNQTEHFIIFSAYKNMGYDENKFVESVVLDQNEWDNFLKTYNRTKISIQDVHSLLIAFHHIMLFPIDNRFSSHIKQLKHTERELWEAFKKFKHKLPKMESLGNDVYPLDEAYEYLFNQINLWCEKYVDKK